MLIDPVRQVGALRTRGHRPWALPKRPWLMGQTWHDLLFAHWRVEPDDLRAVIPEEVPLDVFDGSCWVGVTPFEVSGLRPLLAPPLPWLSRFGEINVRTYATVGGRPGIWFMSLDAARLPAVHAARRGYRLPYFHARIDIERGAPGVHYRADRRSGESAPVGFEGRYRPTGPVRHAPAGSLEHFLTERYCLYALDEDRRLLRAEIHHPPWPIQDAEAEIRRNSMAAPYGLALDDPPLLHFSRRQDVLIWAARPVTGSSA